jgi:hypothetical protein
MLDDAGTLKDLTHALDRLVAGLEGEWAAPRIMCTQSA